MLFEWVKAGDDEYLNHIVKDKVGPYFHNVFYNNIGDFYFGEFISFAYIYVGF